MTEPLFQRVVQGGSNQIYYYQNDHLGTPQRMINQSGATVWQADYSAFGQAYVQVETVQNNLRFPGQYFDAESGLHQNYFRDYDPELGRYIQSDPIGLAGGLNTYGYAYQSPLNFFDVDGLLPCPPGWADTDNCWIDGPGGESGYPNEGRCVTGQCSGGLPPIPEYSPCVTTCMVEHEMKTQAACKFVPTKLGKEGCRIANRIFSIEKCKTKCELEAKQKKGNTPTGPIGNAPTGPKKPEGLAQMENSNKPNNMDCEAI